MQSTPTHAASTGPMLYGPWLYPAAPLSWLAAPWACVCGAAASGAWTWSGANFLDLLLGLLLTGPLLGLACDSVLALRSKRLLWLLWALGLSPRPQPVAGEPHIQDVDAASSVATPFVVPYTLPGSASDRVAAWVQRFGARWKLAGLHVRRPLVQWSLATLFSLVVARQLGVQPFLLAAAGSALIVAMAIGLRTRGPAVLSALPAVLAWLLGHATYAGLTPASAAIAACFGWAFYACQQVDQGVASPWRAVIPEAITAVLLVAIKQPVAAAVVASLTLPGVLLSPLLERDSGHDTYFHALQIALAANMLVTALAAGYRP